MLFRSGTVVDAATSTVAGATQSAPASPKGLVLLLSPALVIAMLLRRTHLITALLTGVATAVGIALALQLVTPYDLLHIAPGTFGATGVLVDGMQRAIGVSVFTLLLANLLMRPILVALFEPNVAAAQGVPVRFVQYLLFALMVMSLVASLQAVGCVLSVGLLVTPAATVSLFTDRTSHLFWGGGFLGAFGAVLAVIISVPLNLTPGPAIVMVLGILFILGWLLSPKYGALTRRKTA